MQHRVPDAQNKTKKGSLEIRNTEVREFTFLVGSGNMSNNWNINTRLDSNGGQQPRQHFVADDVNKEGHTCLNHVLNFTVFVLRYMFTRKTWRKTRYELASKRWARGVNSSGSLNLGDGGKRSIKPSCLIHSVAATGGLHAQ
jgi:hypothetical protein